MIVVSSVWLLQHSACVSAFCCLLDILQQLRFHVLIAFFILSAVKFKKHSSSIFVSLNCLFTELFSFARILIEAKFGRFLQYDLWPGNRAGRMLIANTGPIYTDQSWHPTIYTSVFSIFLQQPVNQNVRLFLMLWQCCVIYTCVLLIYCWYNRSWNNIYQEYSCILIS